MWQCQLIWGKILLHSQPGDILTDMLLKSPTFRTNNIYAVLFCRAERGLCIWKTRAPLTVPAARLLLYSIVPFLVTLPPSHWLFWVISRTHINTSKNLFRLVRKTSILGVLNSSDHLLDSMVVTFDLRAPPLHPHSLRTLARVFLFRRLSIS